MRPAFECDDKGVLGKLFGKAYVAHHARQPCDEFRLLDPEDRFNGAMGVGSRHDYRSHHLPVMQATRALTRIAR